MARRPRHGRPWTSYSLPYDDIPKYLYFVEHAGSQSFEDNNGTFWAADGCTTGRRGLVRLQNLIDQHVNWYNRSATRFISAFSNYKHARNWAMQRYGPVTIHTINTCLVCEDCPPIFYAPRFTDNCWETSEYLFLNYIPGHSIIRSRTL
ncbi:hypothetical protein NEUTE1DRAFT_124979 [Neurospora tetrasperma FGSC 2508]|uniref:DUF7587 domain-containing protein n=1 Tax=Neurospora tetrasperma (strain FGSC 2508 / ATCC MYA-4615 / P0657) TaxID=510951 RepID=F8MVZ6_NEUT8|nr:uncharacterized protein NEUTE1DRAFT_124979 [Neurospora tetrasperma FGSC 2508]EGO54844.1 hypothetical protein NEUTE1DRAFT_124979 [Neurospora tetrasperma FGSC 2508]EGZ67667.1 hypothetical protein NEUTE2DRAFT_116858 [Neurospora tetrasperma FGSC 2509]